MSEHTSTPSRVTGTDPHPGPGMLPAPGAGPIGEPVRRAGHDTDRLVSISDIRMLFKLGRTAAYELTHRPGFPAPVQVSRRCLRWWASEVDAYTDTLQREGAQCRTHRTATRRADSPSTQPRRITGTVRAARSRREQA